MKEREGRSSEIFPHQRTICYLGSEREEVGGLEFLGLFYICVSYFFSTTSVLSIGEGTSFPLKRFSSPPPPKRKIEAISNTDLILRRY